MNVQFLYHPENDEHVAAQIIRELGCKQSYSISGLRIGELTLDNNELKNAIDGADLVVLLIGSKFEKIIPALWTNHAQGGKAMFGIRIHRIPDEWGDTRKSAGKIFDRFVSTDGKPIGVPFDLFEPPEDTDQLAYIKWKWQSWCNKAIDHARNNHGIT